MLFVEYKELQSLKEKAAWELSKQFVKSASLRPQLACELPESLLTEIEKYF